jgi:hypothetical protein
MSIEGGKDEDKEVRSGGEETDDGILPWSESADEKPNTPEPA